MVTATPEALEPTLRRRARPSVLVGSALLVAMVGLMAWATWATWPDIDIDSGREAYIPARLAGLLPGGRALLYRDLQFQFGPLTPYLHALLFRLAGVKLAALYAAGLVIAAVLAVVNYAIARYLAAEPIAWLMAAAFVVIFEFRPTPENYIYPYTYAASYGVLLLCVMLLLTLRQRFEAGARRSEPWIAGVCLGLSALNKIEFAAGALVCAALLIGLRRDAGRRGYAVIAITLPALLLPVAVYGYFVWHMGMRRLIDENLLAGYIVHAQRYFYWRLAHLDTFRAAFMPYQQLRSFYLPVMLWMWLVARIWLRRRVPGRREAMALLVVMLAGPVILFWIQGWRYPAWRSGIFYPWLLSLVMIVGGAWLWRCQALSRRAEAAWMIAAAGCLPLLRMLNNPDATGYGNFLMWPSMLLYFWILFDVAPGAMSRPSRLRPYLTRAATMLFAMVIATYAAWDFALARTKSFAVGAPPGVVRTDADRGIVFRRLIDDVKTEGGHTLLVAPEGAFLYVFTGTVSPLPYTHLVPGHASDPKHEQEAIARLEQRPPDHVVIDSRKLDEYFPSRRESLYFGRAYNQALYGWIVEHYRRVKHYQSGNVWADLYTPVK